MQVPTHGAQRASRHRTIRLMAMSALALSLAVSGLAARPEAAAAGGVKVTIIVGPVESSTDRYRDTARGYADLARSLSQDLRAVLAKLDAIKPGGEFTEEHFAH